MLRYNRIEGLSAGVLVERELGQGYTEGALLRVGTFASAPIGELYLRRSNIATDMQGARLSTARRSERLGKSTRPRCVGECAVFGRDDGFYYRTIGAEVNRDQAERQRRRASFAGACSASSSRQPRRRDAGLARARDQRQRVRAEPPGAVWQLLRRRGHARVCARRQSNRAACERQHAGRERHRRVVVRTRDDRAHGFGGPWCECVVRLTGAAGSSLGTLPTQRWWFLGSPYTVHGQSAGAAAGTSFWLARAELSKGFPLVRPVVFADIGWAGPRETFARDAHTISGAGAGAASLEWPHSPRRRARTAADAWLARGPLSGDSLALSHLALVASVAHFPAACPSHPARTQPTRDRTREYPPAVPHPGSARIARRRSRLSGKSTRVERHSAGVRHAEHTGCAARPSTPAKGSARQSRRRRSPKPRSSRR